MTYPVIIIPENAASQLEQLGTKSKFWYRNGATNESMLFKEGRIGTGENWAEKVCCEICALLGVPHAHYEFALCGQREGVATNNFVPKGDRLIHGNELLVKIVDGYDDSKRYSTRQHTVRLVMALLEMLPIEFPLNWGVPLPIQKIEEVFVGYLMLDTLVSNQDRHHENWGLIVTDKQIVHLAPTFDHASSLGRNESDQNRAEMLSTKDKNRTVNAYVRRARSAFYDTHGSGKAMGTVDAFLTAAKMYPNAGEYWLDRLNKTSKTDYQTIIDLIPNGLISQQAADFSMKMLEENRARLLNAGN